MSYEKTTWATGDVITAEKLNNIEDGVEDASGGESVVVTLSAGESGIVADKTFSELAEAVEQNKVVIIRTADSGMCEIAQAQYGEVSGDYVLTGFYMAHNQIQAGDDAIYISTTEITYPAEGEITFAQFSATVEATVSE